MNILSIQSHVTYGHVGNAAAGFVLERLGLSTWRVNTVQLSNHKGYPSWRGQTFDAGEIAEVIEGMEQLGILATCDGVLSGYLGDPEMAGVVLDAVARVRRHNPAAVYLCDPVMGDLGIGLYVADEVPSAMAERAVPLADIVTPNQFELELLTGGPLDSLDDALAAARRLMAQGPKVVVVTSLRHAGRADDEIAMLAVTKDGAWLVTTPFLHFAQAPSGAGDAVAALFLANYLKAPAGAERARQALELAAAAIYGVIEATHQAGSFELQLIAAQDALVTPATLYSAKQIA